MEPGTELGPYRVVEPLGAGGMGEVYLADDTRLGRRVAIKVLPTQFASDPERLARFQTEAQAAAALNHPHIAAIFDIGEAESADGTTTHYMVQEYLQGRTLRERMEQGPMPLAEVLERAVEIAEALAAAHRAGIVHRDIKPDNVFVTEDGHAKVLDFGLAKLTEAAAVNADVTMSPTMVGTMAGMALGTAGYMAPEQVQGGEVDRRADIFAFGCVLYEMATGQQPFAGRTLHHTLDRILSEEPLPVREVAAKLPDQLQWIVTKCLSKLPARRYQHADDLVVDLASLSLAVERGMPDANVDPVPVPPAPEVARPTRATWGIAAVAVVAAAIAAWGWLRPVPAAVDSGRFELALDGGQGLTLNLDFEDAVSAASAVSPDGSRVVFAAGQQGDVALYERRLDSFEIHRLPDTEDGVSPFFSPDSRAVAFLADTGLKVLRLDGGSVTKIADVGGNVRGGFWADDGTIYLGHSNDPGSTQGILTVPSSGGEPTVLVEPEAPGSSFRYPQLLPGGDYLLITIEDSETNARSGKEIAVYQLSTGEFTTLGRRGSYARYLSTGHLVFGRDNKLLAAPFDLERLELTGAERVVIGSLEVDDNYGFARWSVTDGGTLVYAEPTSELGRLVWVDPGGEIEPLTDEARAFRTPEVSPDGRRVAVWLAERGGQDIWTFDIQRGVLDRLTNTQQAWTAQWARDGSHVLFQSDIGTTWGTWMIAVDGSSPPEPVSLNATRGFNRVSLHPDGVTRVYSSGGQIFVHREGEDRDEPFFETSATLGSPTLSPDGAWLAYTSDEQGSDQLYVRSFPDGGRRLVVSIDGAAEPRWARDGRRLYFRDGTQFLAAAFDPTADPPAGVPERLFELDVRFGWGGNPNYDVAPDGRVLVVLSDSDVTNNELKVVRGWFDELESLVPTGR